MAGDWIKMRSSLLTHPKVISMVNVLEKNERFMFTILNQDALYHYCVRPSVTDSNVNVTDLVTRHALRYVTVSALLSLWSAARLHSDDGILHGNTIYDLDEMAGMPGIGVALESVGWACYDEERKCVILKDFASWNDQSFKATPKTNAERQRDYRNRQKNSVTKSNESNARVEKSREEKSREKEDDGGGIVPSSHSEILNHYPEQARKPSLQAAIAYQTRRYGSPNPNATWYSDLLREAGSVFEVHEDPQQALQKFLPVANSPPSLQLPRNATFSDLCIAAGIKKPRAAPWEQAKADQDEKARKKLSEILNGSFRMPS